MNEIMRKIDAFSHKINFKQVIKIYLALALVAGLASLIAIGLTYQREIITGWNARNAVNDFKHGNKAAMEVKAVLQSLADNNPGVKDILITDQDNLVIYTARHTIVNEGDLFNLSAAAIRAGVGQRDGYGHNTKKQYDANRCLEQEVNKGQNTVEFASEDELQDNALEKIKETKNYRTGEKIYFFTSKHKIAKPLSLWLPIGIGISLFVLVYWFLLAAWVYNDAKKSGFKAELWGLLTLSLNLGSFFVYLVYKRSRNGIFK